MSDHEPTTTPVETARAMTVRELIQTLTTLAGELPRGLDTPVEVGLERDGLDSSAAINVYPTTAVWPGRGDDGADCRATTVQLTGEPNHPDADRHDRHARTGHPDWEDPR